MPRLRGREPLPLWLSIIAGHGAALQGGKLPLQLTSSTSAADVTVDEAETALTVMREQVKDLEGVEQRKYKRGEKLIRWVGR